MSTIETTVSYSELVERGREARELADGVQWVEGDLALQVEALPGDERPRDPETGLFIEDETKQLKRYADDIGITFATLKTYRLTAVAWPTTLRRAEVSWHVHKTLAAQEDRFDLIRPAMTVREAERIVTQRRAGNTGKPGWNELLGHVGDHLKHADKAMGKAEAAIADNVPNLNLRQKADRYAAWAENLAERLHRTAQGPQEDKA